MEVIIAKNSGLCYGVTRALKIAKQVRRSRSGQVYTLGDLIHNPQVIADLNAHGITPFKNSSRIPTGTLIIRSHGISPDLHQKLSRQKIEIVDATCPIVKKIQELVEHLAAEGNEIIIVGNRRHPETQGLIGYSRGKGIVIESESQAKKLPRQKKRAILVQSTQDIHLFKRIVSILIDKTPDLSVHNTICQSTLKRQKATSELASQVDALFVIGGKNSSNTHKLYKVSRQILPETYFIENAEQITPEMLKGAKKIGLTGGASTPPEAIEEAAVKIKSGFATKHQNHREKTVQCLS